MANPKSFPLVRGRTMRITEVTGCGEVVEGPDSQVVTDGFVSVALTANINEGDEIRVVAANGRTCVLDTPCPEFTGYTVEITFCDVNPCLFGLVTGQPPVLDDDGAVAGFRMNTSTNVCDKAFALEVWSSVPGEACSGDQGAFGYILFPFVRGGVIGDFTIENAAVSFVLTGAVTKDGNAWGTGPYTVVENTGGAAAKLPDPIDVNDHMLAIFTTIAPPEPSDGCVTVGAFATGAVAGIPGTYTPTGAMAPNSVSALQAGVPATVVATPTTAWTTGQYIQTQVAGTAGRAHWSGSAWVAGAA